jgi:hypothetical protein
MNLISFNLHHPLPVHSASQIVNQARTDTSTVNYNLSTPENIRLSLFCSLGQQISILDESWKEAGDYNLQ